MIDLLNVKIWLQQLCLQWKGLDIVTVATNVQR